MLPSRDPVPTDPTLVPPDAPAAHPDDTRGPGPSPTTPTTDGQPATTPAEATQVPPPQWPPAPPVEATAVAPPPRFADVPTAVPAPPPAERDATLLPPAGWVGPGPAANAATLVPPAGWSGPPLGGTQGAPTAIPLSARPAFDAAGQVVGRFAVRGLHAKGGLGEVLTARDTELNRDVALKRIQARFADDPNSRRRFLSEAEITARLDHPGVVPVFGLVADGFGRPCYAMRFIRGESLKDEIDRFHGTPRGTRHAERGTDDTTPSGNGVAAPRSGARPGAPRSVAFRKLLQRFIAVCQAIAYAHTRGVIHRDIKPANVMVGTFGETLVVDWGLAKVVGEPTPDRPSGAIRPPRPDPEATEEMTAAGTALGTPAYMPPEQAAGQLDRIGPRSDIYSLGATLYCVLTGKAPFSGTTVEEIVEKVQKADFPPPREVNPETPKPLEAIARKAMAPRPEDRYPDALALAADVERWLSDEPVSCYPDPFTARLARWARRNPARVAGTVSLLLTGLLGVAAVLGLVNEERKKTDEQRQAAVAARDAETEAKARAMAALESETAAKQATEAALRNEERAKAQVVEARDAAAQRSRLALQAFGILVQEVQDQLADRAGTQALRQELLRRAQDGLEELLRVARADKLPADHTRFHAFARMGELRLALGETRAARDQYERAVGVAREVHADRPDDVEARRDLGDGLARLAEALLLTGDSAEARKQSEESLHVRAGVLAADPKDRTARRELAAGHRLAATVELELGNTAAALTACRAGLAIRKELVAEAEKEVAGRWVLSDAERKLLTGLRRDLAESHDQEAEILLLVGNTAAALDAATAGRDLRAAVAARQAHRTESRRELAAAHHRVAQVHLERGETTAALADFNEGRKELEAALKHDERCAGARADLAAAHGWIGATQLRVGKHPEALAATRESLALCRKLAADDPDSAKALRELAQAHERYGDALLADDKPADALAEYRRSEEILTGLSRKDPESGRRKAELGRVYQRLGDALLASGDVPAARAALATSLGHRQAVAADDQASARAKRFLLQTWDRLAAAARAAGDTAAARAAADRALELAARLAAADPNSGQAKRDLAVARGAWGLALSDQGEKIVPLVAWLKALDGYEELAAKDPESLAAREDVANAAAWLADVYTAARLPGPALAAANKGLAVRRALAAANPDNRYAHRNLMRACRAVGDVYAQGLRFGEADGWYAEALRVAERFADPAALAAEAAAVKEQRQVCEAITAGMAKLDAVKGYTNPVLARALVVLVDVNLRRGRRVEATAAADLLAAAARGPEDYYAAARGYAAAASGSRTDGERRAYVSEAVKYLRQASDAGFRDGGRLDGPPWDAVRADPAFGPLVETIRNSRPAAPAGARR